MCDFVINILNVFYDRAVDKQYTDVYKSVIFLVVQRGYSDNHHDIVKFN